MGNVIKSISDWLDLWESNGEIPFLIHITVCVLIVAIIAIAMTLQLHDRFPGGLLLVVYAIWAASLLYCRTNELRGIDTEVGEQDFVNEVMSIESERFSNSVYRLETYIENEEQQ